MTARSTLWNATFVLGMASAIAVMPSFVRAGDADDLESFQAMSDSLKAADSYAFSAGVFFDEMSPTGLRVKRYAKYDVSVQHPDKLAWSVSFDDGTARRGVFDGSKKQIVFTQSANKSYTRLPFEGTVDELIDHLQDEYGIGLPIADFVYSDMMASHKPHIVTATDLGDRVLPGKTLSHLLIEGSAADWQIWIDNEAPRLPLRFVATYIRQLGDPEYMITFSNWTLNQVSDSDFELGLPSGWTEIDIVAAE